MFNVLKKVSLFLLAVAWVIFLAGCSAEKKVPEKPAPAPAETKPPVVQEAEKAHNYSLLVKKSAFTVSLLDDGKEVKIYKCALGKNPGQKEKEGDLKTPTGTFLVDEILDASAWTHDFGDGKGEIKGAYGPWFISLDTNEMSKGKWGGIGIHGTHDPASIGTLASEGCIRLENDNLNDLKKHVKVGTKVVIEE